MLVLTRYTGEKIIIQAPGLEAVTITLVEVRGGKVRVGIKAAPEVKIWRQELGKFSGNKTKE